MSLVFSFLGDTVYVSLCVCVCVCVVVSSHHLNFSACMLSTTLSLAAGGNWRLQYVVNHLLSNCTVYQSNRL